MIFGALGDIHAHKFSEFSEPDAEYGNTRLREIVMVIRKINEDAKKRGIKYMLFDGDLYHVRKAVDTHVWNAMFDEVKNSGLTYIMIPGNHDQVDNSDFPEHSLHGFRDLPNVILLDRFTPYTISEGDKGYYIFPSPYSKNAAMVKKELEGYAYTTVNEGLEDRSILLGHLGISGAFVGKSNYAMSDAFAVSDLFPHAFRFGVFGHFHKWQELGGLSHFFYTGAPIQHNFNDEGQEKGYWVLDMETGKAELVPIDSPKFITVTDPKVDPETLVGNYVRFQINEKDVAQLTENIEGNTPDLKFRIEPQKVFVEERRVDIDFSMSFAEIVTKYAENFKPEAKEFGLEILREAEQS